ncbi:type III pantothenate kinase [Methylobacillus flagellatus]|uniref:type III pantothenate kinase n=1 Tax=Methylobacillus flagellatus TaxID=405 RepID=UPI0010F89C1D|nr:type III pantothenate kinase [Methylobacillus flagellatus]
MLLAIDSGNTRTKWALFDLAGTLQAHDAALNLAFNAPPAAWQLATRVIVCNVAGAARAEHLARLLQPLGVTVQWLTASAAAGGVLNHYRQPGQLGADRWAALVAAWQRLRGSCVVVNAGTAVTIDALQADAAGGKAVFLGGLIVPGLRLMRQSLAQGTAGVDAPVGAVLDFPQTTADAVSSGALAAIGGAVLNMHHRLQQQAGSAPHCLISGGDGPALLAWLRAQGMNKHIELEPHLVLHGLRYLVEGAR